MKAEWIINQDVLNNISKVIQNNIHKTIVQERIKKNIEKQDIDLSYANIWKTLVGCEITTQQKSGLGSHVDVFLKSNNQVLDYEKCKHLKASTISKELREGHLGKNKRIGSYLARIINLLEDGEWNTLCYNLETLKREHTQQDEIIVVEYLRSGRYPGLGLKQSRNFIQWLGLSEYEIPIDSRELKVLKECKCNFVPGASALQDEVTYLFLERGIQKACELLDIKPCILDACFFASFEEE